IDWNNFENINIYNSISPYSINTNMYNRILKLRLRENMNWIIFTKDLNISDITLKMPEPEVILTNFIQKGNYMFLTKNIKKVEMIEYLIADSIFCCSEISKICSTFDPSFSLNHSLLAENHLNFWKWCQYLDSYLVLLEIVRLYEIEKNKDEAISLAQKKYSINKEYSEEKLRIEIGEKIDDLIKLNGERGNVINGNTKIIEIIKKLIEPDNYLFVSQSYQLEKTINCYYAMKYSHKQGAAYRNFIENMYFLNDDFNDELYHFSAALERYKINCGYMEKSIDNLKKQKINSRLYDSKNYMHEYNIENKSNTLKPRKGNL
ncbi:MAG: hypothetical protein M0P66_11825, partial [Salinivirgaceae bacterium]|nr:hypothetical protein [Salinivirgaceae bacterium]